MHQGKYVFAQLAEFIPRREFDKFVAAYQGNARVRSLDCRDQFLAMMFGQIGNLKSLSGITSALNAHQKQLFHLGFKSKKFILSTLTRANENRDWRIWRDLAEMLIKRARKLYVDDNDFQIDLVGTPYALDSTIVEMSLGLFPWAKFEKGHSAIRVHTQLDLKGNIPAFFRITEARVHDINFLDILEFEKGNYYIMDRGYIDFERLYKIHRQASYFIIRSKKNLSFHRIYSRMVDRSCGLRCDQIIKLKQFYRAKDYPEKLRRVKYYDAEINKYYVYLTNNFEIAAFTVAELYRHRWQIELFFKWIKQHLHINTFWGTSRNAVKTQICIAISAFLLVAIMKKELGVQYSLYEILQILSVSLLEKIPINTLFLEPDLQILEDQTQKRLFSLDF